MTCLCFIERVRILSSWLRSNTAKESTCFWYVFVLSYKRKLEEIVGDLWVLLHGGSLVDVPDGYSQPGITGRLHSGAWESRLDFDRTYIRSSHSPFLLQRALQKKRWPPKECITFSTLYTHYFLFIFFTMWKRTL